MNFLLKISALLKYHQCPVLLMSLGKEMRYSLYRIKKKKDDVEFDLVIDQEQDLSLLGDKKYQLRGKPLVLSLHGDGVVQRLFDGDLGRLNTVIPNINLENYCLQSHELELERSFVSLVRLEVLDRIVDNLNDLGLYVSRVDLGFRSIVEYTNALAIKNEFLYVGNQYLQFDKGNVLAVGKDDSPKKNATNGNNSVALGAGINFFLNSFQAKELRSSLLQNNYRELISAKINSLVLKYILPVLMGLLLLNFFLFEKFQTETNLVLVDFDGISELRVKIDHLKKQLVDENEFHSQTDSYGVQHFALYIDRISSKSISGIRFTDFQVNPLKKKIRKNEIIEYQGGDFIIEGIADNQDCFSQFLESLDESDLGMKIERQVYFYDKVSKQAKFEVLLKINDDKVSSAN